MDTETRISKLLAAFIDSAIKHQTLSLVEWKSANKEARKLQKIFLELKSLGQPGREALLGLVSHKDLSVSLMAAVFSLKYNPDKSLKALRKLVKEHGFIGFQAEQAIKRWEEGTWNIE